jgi:hypothetical protein
MPFLASAESTMRAPRTAKSIIRVTFPMFIFERSDSDLYFLVYVAKDPVPDVILLYRKYKSIQRWLQNDTPPSGSRPTGGLLTPAYVFFFLPLAVRADLTTPCSDIRTQIVLRGGRSSRTRWACTVATQRQLCVIQFPSLCYKSLFI